MIKDLSIDITFDENGHPINVLYIDNEVFDWGIEEKDLKNALNFIIQNPTEEYEICENILNHFLDSFSDQVETSVSLDGFLECLGNKQIDTEKQLFSSEVFNADKWKMFLDYNLYNLGDLKQKEYDA